MIAYAAVLAVASPLAASEGPQPAPMPPAVPAPRDVAYPGAIANTAFGGFHDGLVSEAYHSPGMKLDPIQPAASAASTHEPSRTNV